MVVSLWRLIFFCEFLFYTKFNVLSSRQDVNLFQSFYWEAVNDLDGFIQHSNDQFYRDHDCCIWFKMTKLLLVFLFYVFKLLIEILLKEAEKLHCWAVSLYFIWIQKYTSSIGIYAEWHWEEMFVNLYRVDCFFNVTTPSFSYSRDCKMLVAFLKLRV